MRTSRAKYASSVFHNDLTCGCLDTQAHSILPHASGLPPTLFESFLKERPGSRSNVFSLDSFLNRGASTCCCMPIPADESSSARRNFVGCGQLVSVRYFLLGPRHREPIVILSVVCARAQVFGVSLSLSLFLPLSSFFPHLPLHFSHHHHHHFSFPFLQFSLVPYCKNNWRYKWLSRQGMKGIKRFLKSFGKKKRSILLAKPGGMRSGKA